MNTTRVTLSLLFFVFVSGPLAAAQERVLVRDDDVAISFADVEKEIAVLEPTERAMVRANKEKYLDLLNRMYRREKLMHAAEAKGIPGRPELEYKLYLARKDVVISALVDELRASIEVPDLEGLARERYDANREKYREPSQVEVAHILFKAERCADRPGALAKAEAAYEKLKNGADFGELAEAVSEDGSAASGGKLGWRARTALIPEFSDVVFELEPGAISEPFETKFGVHIAKVTDKRPERALPFDEVKADIVKQLEAEFTRDRYNSKIEKIIEPKSMTVDEASLEATWKELNGAPKP